MPGGFAVFQNKLLIFGGFTIGGAGLNSIYQFDPTLGVGSKWVLKSAVLPVAMAYIPATTIGTLVFTGGGSTVAAGALTDSTNSFVYNPVGDSISTIASIPRATGETRAVNVGNKMWVLGGGRTAPNPSNEVDIYDPGLGTWSMGLPFVTPRRNFAADSDGTRVFLAGGYTGAAPGTPVNTTEVFGAVTCPTPTPSPTIPPSATPSATPTIAPTPTPTTLPPATPSATPTPGACGLVNSGFETGTFPPWVILDTAPLPFVSNAQAHSGTQSAFVGSPVGGETPGDSSFYQTITVPAGGGTLSSYWYFPTIPSTVSLSIGRMPTSLIRVELFWRPSCTYAAMHKPGHRLTST